MFCFKQSIYAVNLKYLEDNFEHYVNLTCGERKEFSDFTNTATSKNLFSKSDIRLNFSNSYLKKIKQFLKFEKNELKKQNIEFFVYLNLHNEKVLIDEVKEDNRSYGYVRVVLRKKDNVFIEDLLVTQNDPSDLEEKIKYYIKKVQKNVHFFRRSSSHLKSINLPAVLSPQSAGYFVHEILGHTLEGDFYSFYKNKYENLKISPMLTVCDAVEGFTSIIGLNKYDDEGTEIKPLTLIENGKICNVLAIDKNDSFDNKLYGTARRENYKTNTMPRMRGTFVLPYADIGLQGILNKYNEAVYMEKAYYGNVDLQTGDYFISGYGFIVNYCEFQKFIGKLKLSGNIFKSLSSFDYIGNDFKMFGSYCIKMGQCVRVGIGGPAISLFGLTVEGDLY